MDLKNIHKSKTVRGVLVGVGVTILVLVIFQAGMVMGYHKARFAGAFGNNFERNFIGSRGGGMKMMFNGAMPSGYGAVGEIVSINLPQIIVSGPDNIEKTVTVSTTTSIRRFRDEIQASELVAGEFVVILGNPNESGQIEANLVRIMPAPTEEFTRQIPR